jgi:putative tricarboxylic transport membrane protein
VQQRRKQRERFDYGMAGPCSEYVPNIFFHEKYVITSRRLVMARNSLFSSTETVTLTVLLAVSGLSLIFIQSLVAMPKALFGRSLSAIPPSMFPGIVLGLIVLLCAGALWMIRSGTVAEPSKGMTRTEWVRAITLFAIMTLYALTMAPFGFLISTAIATTLISLQMGARSIIQIGSVALIGPVLLYLAATELLAVSLPELNVIELAYARLLAL